MQPWEFAEQLTAATDQEAILKDISPTDPFWVGAGYCVNPFVGPIFKLPLSDPHRHERGLPASMFDRMAQAILGGHLCGDLLIEAVEAMSKACTRDQWTCWYRPILEGKLDLRLPLALFNRYSPTAVPEPAFNKPKRLTVTATFTPPAEYFVQPAYDHRCFWFIDSTTALIQVRGYDENCVRVHDAQIEKSLFEIGQSKPVDLVIFGYIADGLIVDDLVRRSQFTSESSNFPLRQRLEAAAKLGLPLVQRSTVLYPGSDEFTKELKLIFEQKFRAALLRDLDAVYPFRVQSDWKLSAKSWLKDL